MIEHHFDIFTPILTHVYTLTLSVTDAYYVCGHPASLAPLDATLAPLDATLTPLDATLTHIKKFPRCYIHSAAYNTIFIVMYAAHTSMCHVVHVFMQRMSSCSACLPLNVL